MDATVESALAELRKPKDKNAELRLTRFDVPVEPALLVSTTERLVRDAPLRLVTAFARESPAEKKPWRVTYVYASLDRPAWVALSTHLAAGEALPSVARVVPAANWLEREIAEMHGLALADHPDPRALLQHKGWPLDGPPLAKRVAAGPATKRLEASPDYGFLVVEGDGVCEVPVGPIHAGVIEPGHFRFSVAGEPVLHLEIRLGYQHKGIEKLAEGRTPHGALFLAERTSGDNSVAHAVAFSQAVEDATATEVPQRAKRLRSLFLELERITHHLGDIGGVLLDVAYSFGASQYAIEREEMFRLNARLSGSRLLFGVATPGGVARDVSDASLADALAVVRRVAKESERILKISLASSSVVDRLDGTGALTKEAAQLLAVVGPSARASGLELDARRATPHAAYPELAFAIPIETRGDVMSRIRVKAAEIQESAKLVERLVALLGESPGPVSVPLGAARPGALGLGATESHRGEVLYAIELDADGRIARHHVRDPSKMNWRAVEAAVPNGNIIADFPVINKSFNLSYSGNDR
ncbi:MAG: hydrogenase large subunit [Thermoplasmatota archaeon]